MAQDDGGTESKLPALFKAGADKRGPDAFALMLRDDGHRRETHDPQFWMAGERDGRKHDVPNDCTVVFCDE